MIDIRSLPGLNIEQKVFAQTFYNQFNWDSPGSNHHIFNVEPIIYQGVIAGSDFHAGFYAADKLFFCWSLVVSYDANALIAASPRVRFYDELGVINFYGQNINMTYDSALVSFFKQINTVYFDNLWFSCYDTLQYNYMKFVGYKITLS